MAFILFKLYFNKPDINKNKQKPNKQKSPKAHGETPCTGCRDYSFYHCWQFSPTKKYGENIKHPRSTPTKSNKTWTVSTAVSVWKTRKAGSALRPFLPLKVEERGHLRSSAVLYREPVLLRGSQVLSRLLLQRREALQAPGSHSTPEQPSTRSSSQQGPRRSTLESIRILQKERRKEAFLICSLNISQYSLWILAV